MVSIQPQLWLLHFMMTLIRMLIISAHTEVMHHRHLWFKHDVIFTFHTDIWEFFIRIKEWLIHVVCGCVSLLYQSGWKAWEMISLMSQSQPHRCPWLLKMMSLCQFSWLKGSVITTKPPPPHLFDIVIGEVSVFLKFFPFLIWKFIIYTYKIYV